MSVDGYANKSAAMGSNGMEEVKWLKPVFAGETLTGRRPCCRGGSRPKRPEMGILKCIANSSTWHGELKIEITGVKFMGVRQP